MRQILRMVTDIWYLIGIGPATLVCWFIHDPIFESILFFVTDESDWNQDWKLNALHVFIYLVVAVTGLHIWTSPFLMAIYHDIVSRSLKYISLLIDSVRPLNDECEVARHKRNQTLHIVCQMFTYQQVLNRVTSDLCSHLMMYFMAVLQPSPIPLVYVCVRCYDQLSLIIYLGAVAATLLDLYVLVTVHTFSCSNYEFSSAFLRSRETMIPFWNVHPYWRKKLKAYTPIKWGALWFSFRLDNFLPLNGAIVNACASVLLL